MTDDQTEYEAITDADADVRAVIRCVRERGSAAIAATAHLSPDQIAATHYALKTLYTTTMETTRLIRQGLMERMDDLGVREIETGEGRRIYVGVDRKTTCRDNAGVLAALLEAGGPHTVAGCLSSAPWKLGACREPLQELWGELFAVEEVEVIKDGKATKRRSIQEADDRFTR